MVGVEFYKKFTLQKIQIYLKIANLQIIYLQINNRWISKNSVGESKKNTHCHENDISF